MSILAILEGLNFDFSKFELLSSPKYIYQTSKFQVSKIAKEDIFWLFEFAKICSNVKAERGGKMIKHQQSQALTSHFESFWSIVDCRYILGNAIFGTPLCFSPALF